MAVLAVLFACTIVLLYVFSSFSLSPFVLFVFFVTVFLVVLFI